MPLYQLLMRLISARHRESHRRDRMRQLEIRLMLYPGPPPIFVARQIAADRDDLAIDPLESEFRLDRDHIEVRAWLRLPKEQVPPGMLNALTEAAQRFEGLPPQSRQIFFLSTAYRLTTAEISELLGISRRSVRRQLFAAIARRDGRTL